MSAGGAPKVEVRPGLGAGLKVAVVAALWHQEIMDGLVAGAERLLTEAGAEFQVIRVTGSFELPVAVQAALAGGFDAAVALGVVVRGGTPHFEYVCQAATAGLSQVALAAAKAVGFGLLTVDDAEQALDRAGLPTSREDKGGEAALAALETTHTLRQL
jgi:6,7-dimethyl-8-ribityllumazine synthase